MSLVLHDYGVSLPCSRVDDADAGAPPHYAASAVRCPSEVFMNDGKEREMWVRK